MMPSIHRQRRSRSSVSRKQYLILALSCVLVLFIWKGWSPPGFAGIENAGASNGSRNTSAKMTVEKARTAKQARIKQISILGERNSGTRWTWEHIDACFNHTLPVYKNLTRYKHWFQHENETKYPHDTLVLAQFRNPYDWLMAMEHVPHHSPAHMRTKRGAATHKNSAQNDWKIFLSKPWTTERLGPVHDDDYMCQEDFRYKDIISCEISPLNHSDYNYTIRYSEDQPFYEMRNDGSGRPYDNIMQMRTDKILNFISVENFKGVAEAWRLQYEYLVTMGTQELLDNITKLTGVDHKCTAHPPQVRRPKPSRILSPEHAAYIDEHLDWTVEKEIGYEKQPQRSEQPSTW